MNSHSVHTFVSLHVHTHTQSYEWCVGRRSCLFVIVVLPSIFLLSPSLSMLNIKSVQLLVGEKALQSSVSVFMGAPRFVTCWKCILEGQGVSPMSRLWRE